MGKIDFGKTFSRGWEIFSSNMVPLIVGFFLTVLLSVTIILFPVMYAGFYFMLLKAARGETVEIGDVFHGFSSFGRYFVGGLLVMGVSIIGVLACFIGIFPVMGIILFFFPLMVDKGLGAGEAFGRCWEYFKTDWLMVILLAFVSNLVSQAGSYALGIGVLFTGPYALSVVMAGYEQVFGNVPAAAVAPAAAVEEPPVAPPVE